MRISSTVFWLLPFVGVSLLQAQLVSEMAVVIDNTTPGFAGFGAYPTLNDSGAAAFYAETASGAAGIYRIEPGATPVFLSEGGTGGPSINNAGEVVSRRMTNSGVEIYKGTDAQNLVTVAQTATQAGTFRVFVSPHPFLGANGTTVFTAELNPYTPRRRGIYAGAGDGTTRVVADNTGAFTYFGDGPTLNTAGTVVFTASLNTIVEGLFLGTIDGSGTTLPVITDKGTGLYELDASPAIDNRAQIAFLANENATGAGAIFLIKQDGTGLQKVVDASGPFSAFRSPAINDLGTVAFSGSSIPGLAASSRGRTR